MRRRGFIAWLGSQLDCPVRLEEFGRAEAAMLAPVASFIAATASPIF